MRPESSADSDFQRSVGKGCLAGLGLALGFFAGGIVLFLVAKAAGLGREASLVIGIAGGPVVVSGIVLAGFLMVSRRRRAASPPVEDHDATATWDDA